MPVGLFVLCKKIDEYFYGPNGGEANCAAQHAKAKIAPVGDKDAFVKEMLEI